MGVLTRSEIIKQVELGRIKIDPFEIDNVGPNSIDVRLGEKLILFSKNRVFDPEKPIPQGEIDSWRTLVPGVDGMLEKRDSGYPLIFLRESDWHVHVPRGERFIFNPSWFMLGCTIESTATDFYVPFMCGKSTPARCSLVPHQQAGWGDLGFNGRWVLEITSKNPVWLRAGMKIAQIAFLTPEGDADYLYGRDCGHYQGQMGPTPARD